jgi:hypothetical protein
VQKTVTCMSCRVGQWSRIGDELSGIQGKVIDTTKTWATPTHACRNNDWLGGYMADWGSTEEYKSQNNLFHDQRLIQSAARPKSDSLAAVAFHDIRCRIRPTAAHPSQRLDQEARGAAASGRMLS